MARPHVPPRLHEVLEHVRHVVDPQRQNDVEQLHARALSWQPVSRLPLVVSVARPDGLPFPPLPHGQIFSDPAAMLYNELVFAFGTSIAGRDLLHDDLPCTVRANFGTVVVASMFGAEAVQVGDNPPWVAHDRGGGVSLETVADLGPADLERGWFPHVVQTCDYYRQVLEQYPPLDQLVRIVLPDLQSPFDNLELIVGSDLFAQLHENPALVQRALGAVAQTQIDAAARLAEWITDGPDGFSHQHAMMIRGRILLRNDSVIMMSPTMYDEQIAGHDRHVLAALRGGGVHSCGCIDRYVARLLAAPEIQCLDLGQAPLNDLDAMYALARRRRTALIRVDVDEAELTSARVLDRFPTGVSLRHEAATRADAARIANAYRAAAGSTPDGA